ncbi:MAG: winged helix-turn-helix transcriptional regulator [Clostridiales Family XIII bacterium]|nr:winged helix-turn-helix transcriptional regulator [Clostridiales Family XIII bacterium]
MWRQFGEKFGENETQTQILAAMYEDPQISAKAIAERLGLTTRAVEKGIRALKSKDSIERIGSAKGGHWVIKK